MVLQKFWKFESSIENQANLNQNKIKLTSHGQGDNYHCGETDYLG